MKSRNIIAGFVFLASSYAMAYPMVGDKVEWMGTVVKTGGATMEVSGSKEVLSQDPTTMKWLVKSWWKSGTWEKCETKEVMNMYSSTRWQEILATCVAKGGVIEDVTVTAGTYNTCKMTKVSTGGGHGHDRTDVMWWGDVPFGMVKMMSTDGTTGTVKTMEMKTVTLGQ